MNRAKKIIYLLLMLIPTGFVLFLLGSIHILYLLLGVVVLLLGLLLLKRLRPHAFDWLLPDKKEAPPQPSSEAVTCDSSEPKQVYMVLSEREDFETQRIVVNKPSYSIGRAIDNDCVFDSERVSRYHLRIEYDAQQDVCYAIDLDSANGTYHNGQPMKAGQRYRLSQGDLIQVDDRAFTIEYAHY